MMYPTPRRFTAAGMIAGLLMALAEPAAALPPFWQAFQAKYVHPDSADENVKAFSQRALSVQTGQCLVCHVAGQPKTVRNPFGAELAKRLNKEDFGPARLKAEPEKARQEINAALEKVVAQKVDPQSPDSPTFGQRIAQGMLPGAIPDKTSTASQTAPQSPGAESGESHSPATPAGAAPPVSASQPEAPAAGTAGQLATQLVAQLRTELESQLRAELEPKLREELRTELRAQLIAELKPQLKRSLKAVVMAELNATGPVPTDVEAAAIEQIRQQGGTVMQLAQNDDSRTVSFHLSGSGLTDEGLAPLKSVNKLVDLNLKGTQITNAGLAQIAHITSLTRLNLAQTQISDAGLEHLMGLDNLVYLNLYGSSVTDEGLQYLTGMTNLRKLFLWQSKVTPEGARQLQEWLPDCEVSY